MNENYKKGASCFILQDGKILLTERKTEPYLGYWEVPAGKQEAGESFEETVRREVKEETNLNIEVVKEIGINVDDKHSFESHMFLANIIDGKLTNTEPHAHSKVEFISLDTLPEKLGSSTIKGLSILKDEGYF